MSQSTILDSSDELVFYVDEEGEDFVDDFTFYTGLDNDSPVIGKLLKETESERGGKRVFSYSEKIFVKNLFLTKDNLLSPSQDFWNRIQDPESNSPYQYLRSKLEAHGLLSQDEFEKTARARFLQTLNDAIKGDSLEHESWVSRDLPEKEDALIKALPDPEKQKQWRNRIFLERAFPDLIRATQAGRGLLCFSYVGQHLSVTFRKISSKHGYQPQGYKGEQQEIRKRYLFSLAEYCDLIYDEVFKKTGSNQHAQGMVVVTGSTKSGKSEIARGLIHLYLERKPPDTRRHHLVTFEDPIERLYSEGGKKGVYPWAAIDLRPKSKDAEAKANNRDYTPRQKEKDAGLLQDALADALRQTPALFFVGETRNNEEWKVLLDFAATGHLIVTTAHAGSLVEAMHKIFEALKVETPADRSEIAGKLLAVIHLKSHDLEHASGVAKDKTARTNVLFPTLWRRTPRGVAGLTSDGLASLLPFRPGRNDRSEISNVVNVGEGGKADSGGVLVAPGDEPVSSVGRRWLIEQLIKNENVAPHLEKEFGDALGELSRQAYRKAGEWDLQGT